MSDCVFCKIRDGQIPSMRIDEDERTLTFMDINPLSPGHCLVVTKRHAPTLFEADVEDLKAAAATARRVAANDGKGFDWTPVPGDREAIMKTGERLRAALA